MIIYKIINRLLDYLFKLSGKMKCFLFNIKLGKNVTVLGNPIISRSKNDFIKIGDSSSLISKSRFTALGVNKPVVLRTLYPNAKIIIGKNCGLSGTVICSAVKVEIGDDCLVGADVTIADTDFHSILPRNRRYERRKEKINHGKIKIGNNVFIGTKSVILKNLEIGDNSVIGAGSVVTKSIPANVIAAGNPAVVLKSLIEKKENYDLDLHTCSQ